MHLTCGKAKTYPLYNKQLKSKKMKKAVLVLVFFTALSRAFAGQEADLVFVNLTPYVIQFDYSNKEYCWKDETIKPVKGEIGSYGSSRTFRIQASASFPYCAAASANVDFNAWEKDNRDRNYASITIRQSSKEFSQSGNSSNGLVMYARINEGNPHKITIYITYPQNTWMTRNETVKNSTLKDITLIGAHDAGMGGPNQYTTYANDDNTKTQNKSIFEMLNLGVRRFDFRPSVYQKKMRLTHASFATNKLGLKTQGGFGCTVEAALDQVNQFIKSIDNSSNEVILLDFTHFMNIDACDCKDAPFLDTDFETLSKLIIAKLGANLYKEANMTFDYLLSAKKIKDITQTGTKVIVSFDADSKYVNSAMGIFRNYHNDDNGRWADKNKPFQMEADQFDRLKKNNGQRYFAISWTLTQDAEQAVFSGLNLAGARMTSIYDLAASANKYKYVFYTTIGAGGNAKPIKSAYNFEGMFNLLKCKDINLYPNTIWFDYIDDDGFGTLSHLLNNYRIGKNK
jgi:endogenous inhibitor of DNA gyrase (YacG/DUF329 family)